MSQSRYAILSRLRAANPEAKEMESISYQPWVSVSHELTKQRFVDGLTASHAEIISTKAEQINEVIESVIANKKLKRIAIGTAGEFQEKIELATQTTETRMFDCDFNEIKTELFNEIDAGITHCRAGIADTGTLVLWPDTAEPRSLSLVPPCHIALIQQSTIVSNFAELLIAQDWKSKMPTNVVLVSGPSKTADIQQTLAYGAHGPSQLVVILIEDK
jgi:L-lactate dehydrogenase complex protein LldG